MPDAPPTSVVAYYGAPQTIAYMRKAVIESQSDFATRNLAEMICEGLDSKDYTSEYLALYHFILGHSRYMRDPRQVELVRSPEVISKQLLAGRRPNLDCLPAGTLLLKKGYELVPIENIKVGDEIWGYDRWSRVEGAVYKGILPVSTVSMNNGSSFTATGDHKVYIKRCKYHPDIHGSATACFSHREGSRLENGHHEWEVVRVKVSELVEGMMLVTPERLPFGTEDMDPDRAYVEGLYLSDGWHQNTSFFISGQDGCPKESQKREVQAICERLGIPTTWYRKSLWVKDSEWTKRMHHMGGHAPDKRALSINLNEAAAVQMLRGIMADSGQNTHGTGRTFTSTSELLTIQTRLLHKMMGLSSSERFIPNHGGLGKNPIWRLGIRQRERNDAKAVKALRVDSVEPNMCELPVYDIQTDDHYVYLPRADVTVSNCDDLSIWLAAAILAVGGRAEFVTVAFNDLFMDGRRQYSHVFPTALEPRTHQKIILDCVAAEKTPEMLRRVKAAESWPIAA